MRRATLCLLLASCSTIGGDGLDRVLDSVEVGASVGESMDARNDNRGQDHTTLWVTVRPMAWAAPPERMRIVELPPLHLAPETVDVLEVLSEPEPVTSPVEAAADSWIPLWNQLPGEMRLLVLVLLLPMLLLTGVWLIWSKAGLVGKKERRD